MPAAPRYRIKVLDKALSILELFLGSPGELTLTQIAQQLSMSKATTFRILSVLEGADYLERVAGTQGYRLGIQLYRLGSLVDHTTTLQRVAQPFLQELVERTNETAHLTILNKGQALYLDKIEGKGTVRVVSRPGMRLPAHCSGVGKVLLAHLPEDEVDRVVRERGLPACTSNTITDRAALRAELAQIRERGYAIDDEEIELGLRCVAAPIRDASRRVVAAVSISGPKFRFDGPGLKRFARIVVASAHQVSTALRDESPPEPRMREVHATPVARPRKLGVGARG